MTADPPKKPTTRLVRKRSLIVLFSTSLLLGLSVAAWWYFIGPAPWARSLPSNPSEPIRVALFDPDSGTWTTCHISSGHSSHAGLMDYLSMAQTRRGRFYPVTVVPELQVSNGSFSVDIHDDFVITQNARRRSVWLRDRAVRVIAESALEELGTIDTGPEQES